MSRNRSDLAPTIAAIKRKLMDMKRAGKENGEIRIKVRRGKLGNVFTDASDEKMRRSARTHKPWKNKKAAGKPPDPFGAVDGAPPHPLTRASMYDMDLDVD